MSYTTWMDLPFATRSKVKEQIAQTISSTHASPSWLKHYRDRFMVYLSRGSKDVDRALAMTLVLIEEDQTDFTLSKSLRDEKQTVSYDEQTTQKGQQQNIINDAIRSCILDYAPIPVELRSAANRCVDCQKPLRDNASMVLGMGTDCLLKNAITLGIEDPVKTISALKEHALKLRKSA